MREFVILAVPLSRCYLCHHYRVEAVKSPRPSKEC